MIEDNLEGFYFALPAKGRTNTELREKFILSENVVGQGMSSFTNKPSTSSKLSGGTRSGSTTPVSHTAALCNIITSTNSILVIGYLMPNPQINLF
ncbi:hypothetical protein EB796_016781 [Bugula neritina]|uniref:Uncharacterized protein n=1 Tax=Bugula neritina TaxID=10212 RepID=A0A7J7JFS8_BUGNE|nr:hypothetical protein EB796_016781 [Bugula neritina]